MRSVLLTLVAALSLLAFTGTQVYAAPKGGHIASKSHVSKSKKGGKKKSAKKGGKHNEKKKAEHKKEERKERARR
jgi:hypothetical protein